MYEEKNSKFNHGNIIILILKLILVAIFIFILCWLFLKNNKQGVVSENNREFIDNINYMKESAKDYFSKNNLPQKNGEKVKLTLEDMIDQKLILDFTNNGKSCSLKDSYVQVTKTEDNDYALKVNLKCGKTEDFIVTSMASKEVICQDCNEKDETNEPTPEQPNISINENNQNNQNDAAKEETTNKKTITTKKTTTKVVTKITYKYYDLCNDCTVTHPKTKEKYYEVYSYTDWAEGSIYGDNYENKCERDNVYTYCKTNIATFYSNCTIPQNFNQSSYTYTLSLDNINSKKIGAQSWAYGYYETINDYETYLSKKASKVEENTSKQVELVDAQTMMNAALKKENFTYNPQKFYLENGIYKMKIKIDILNKNGVTPYYSKNLGYNVYFVPVKFSLRLIDYDTCVRDLISNKYKYPNYTTISNESVTRCQHRQKITKWVKENELEQYLNNGWNKTGNIKEK